MEAPRLGLPWTPMAPLRLRPQRKKMWYMGNVKLITRTKQTRLVKTTCSNSSNNIVSSSTYEALAMCYVSFSTGIRLSGKSVHHVNVSFHACHHVKIQTLLTRCPSRPCRRETDQEKGGKEVEEGILKINHSGGKRLGWRGKKKIEIILERWAR